MEPKALSKGQLGQYVYWAGTVLVYSYTLQGLWPFFFWPQHSKGYSYLGSSKLGSDVIRKNYPRSVLTFDKIPLPHPQDGKGQRIRGHDVPVYKKALKGSNQSYVLVRSILSRQTNSHALVS